MYLSELFLQEMGDDHSSMSAYKALQVCQQEMNARVDVRDIEAFIEYFFDEDENGHGHPNANYKELMDFWNVFKEFEESTRKYCEDEVVFPLLNTIMEVSYLFLEFEREEMKDSLSENVLKQYKELIDYIDNQPNKLVLQMYTMQEDKLTKSWKYNLTEYDRQDENHVVKMTIHNMIMRQFLLNGIMELIYMNANDQIASHQIWICEGKWEITNLDLQ